MTIKLANNVSGFLNTAITASDTGIVLQSGNGASFPSLSAGEYFYATLVSTGGTLEVVKVTARSGDSMTVVRAQDNSSAASFAAGSRLEIRVTVASVRDAISDVATASAIGFTPVGGISATNVQAAIAELDSEAAKSAVLAAAGGAALIGNTPAGTIAATNMQSAINEIVSDLAASSGSSLVGFLQAGSGAVQRTVQSKLRDVVSVKDFGAVGDGITDDTVAIQAALNSGAAVVNMDNSNYRITSLSIPEGVTLKGQGKSKTTLTCASNTTPIVMANVNDAGLEGILIIAHASQTAAIIAINATTKTVARCRVIDVQCSGSVTDFPFISLATTSGAYGNWAHIIEDVSVSGCGTIFRAETNFAASWINSIQMSHVYANDFIRGVHLINTAGEGCSDCTFFDWATQTSARTQFGALISDVSTQGYNRKNSFHDVRWYDLINCGGLGYYVGSNVLDTNVSGLLVDEMTPLRFLDRGVNTLLNGMRLFDYVSRKARRGFTIPTNTGLTASTSGTGTTASLVTYLQLRSGATAGSLARLYSTDIVCGLSQNQLFNVDFGFPLRFTFLLTRITSEASCIGRVQFKTTQADGSLAAKGIGVQINNYTVAGESYGSSLSTINLGLALNDAETYKIDVLHYPAQRIEWWVNGVLAATQTTSTAIPSGVGVCYFHSSLANVAASDVQMFVGSIEMSAGI